MTTNQQIAVILPAGGRSVRFGGGRNKLLEDLSGQTVLWRTIDALIDLPGVSRVVLSAGEGVKDYFKQDPGALALAKRGTTKLRIVDGGTSRADSVLCGLRAVEDQIDWVAVHDAARPLITAQLFDRVRAAAFEHGAAVPALPVTLTIKQARGPLPAKVEKTVPRDQLWAMQTPQMMRRSDLLDAFARCPLPLDQITDDAQLLELAGKPVWLVDGEEQNIKITTPADLFLAQRFLGR
ncbi:MAG: 2-C-methyl-D-erythritol 4-phosphate cytidylyltransferase [Phycisphaerales bacterium]|jgi:2-C-methyl-D-erythritol 4-phosphate cytidylyltransferase|nr:2-C-methyl-D-erythritol 4-phosphate cytidylyltransferase [Phycisphaerales bacterium]